MKKVEIDEKQESASLHTGFEERIKTMSIDGLDEWIVRYKRRRKKMEYVCMMMCVLVVPLLTYAFTPVKENGYRMRSTEKLDKKTIYEDALETYKKATEP
ncbi:MAG: hypothetical protein IJ745_03545 [Bacteroidales bacterium]|nr:hypothetical protein [Bacteroidales bacterium]